MKYPSTWKVENDPTPFSIIGLKISAPYNPDSPNYTEYVTLDLSEKIDPVSFMDDMKHMYPGFELLKNEDVNINNHPSKKMEYIQALPDFKMEKLNYLIQAGENTFTFTYGEDLETYPRYVDKIESLINTFEAH